MALQLPPQLGGALAGALGAHRSAAAALGGADVSIDSRSQSRRLPIPPWSVRSKWTGVTEIRPLAIAERSEPSSSSKEGSKP